MEDPLILDTEINEVQSAKSLIGDQEQGEEEQIKEENEDDENSNFAEPLDLSGPPSNE